VLASGDPFWFGAGAVLAEHISPEEMIVLPAPSTFSLAASRLGWPLQETVTLGLHSQPVETLRPHLHRNRRILALSANGATPKKVADLLCRHGFGRSALTVMEAIGGPNEVIHHALADEMAGRDFGPLNVMAMKIEASADALPIALMPGLPDDYFEHDGQITKREVRAITLSSLRPEPGELLWDVGCGSGSVAIEWLLRHPSMKAIGFERAPERAARAARNAAALGVPCLDIREGEAPAIMNGAPPPDAIFVGGGVSSPELMAWCWEALKPGGRIVCNAVTFAGQAESMRCREGWGGALTRIVIEREEQVGRHRGWRPAMPVLQWVGSKPWSS